MVAAAVRPKRIRTEAQKAARRVANGGARRTPAQRLRKTTRQRAEYHAAKPEARYNKARRSFKNTYDEVYETRWDRDAAQKALNEALLRAEAAEARAEAEKQARLVAEGRASEADARAGRAEKKLAGTALAKHEQFSEWRTNPWTKDLEARAAADKEARGEAEAKFEQYRKEFCDWAADAGLAAAFQQYGDKPSRSELARFFASRP